MLYTVVPLERVYHNFREEATAAGKAGAKEKSQDKDMEYRDVPIKHGRIVTMRDGENYIIQKINSTDMGDYLNEEYSPGRAYQEKQ